MGSPLAPVLANLFMGHWEKNWLDNYLSSQVLFYRRYVDDTFCLFSSEEDALMFFDYINARHPSIRFTMEREIDKKLLFLDILLDNSHPSIVTSVYRKKTFTGLLTNYFSFAPLLCFLVRTQGFSQKTRFIRSTIPGLVFIWTLKSLSSYCGKTVFRLGSSTRLFIAMFLRK